MTDQGASPKREEEAASQHSDGADRLIQGTSKFGTAEETRARMALLSEDDYVDSISPAQNIISKQTSSAVSVTSERD